MGSHEVKIPDKGSIQCARDQRVYDSRARKAYWWDLRLHTRNSFWRKYHGQFFVLSIRTSKRTSTVIWKGCWHSPSFANYVFICVRLALYTSVKHHVTIDWMQGTDKPIQLFINPDITETGNNLKQCHFYHWFFFVWKNSYFRNFTYVRI